MIPYDPQSSIESRLLPEDDVVRVASPSYVGTFLPEPRDLKGYVDYSVGFSDAAVILRVNNVRGQWSGPMNSWISTELVVTPTEVLYSNTADISSNHTITLNDDGGGQIRVGRCLVTAGIPINVRKGGLYLFFFAKAEDAHIGPLITRTVFALERGHLVDTWRALKPAGVREAPDGASMSDVRREVKRAAAAKKRESR